MKKLGGSATRTGLLLAGLLAALPAPAAETTGLPRFGGRETPRSGANESIDRFWDLTTLYRDEDNPFLQQLEFVGRFHGDYFRTDAKQGDDDDWIFRRLRLGLEATILEDFTLHVEADFNPQDGGSFYRGLTDAYLAWEPDPDLRFKIGKQSAAFTQDGHTSSNKLLTPERSNIANNLWFKEEYMPGISVRGRPSPWIYYLGLYSGGSANKEFGTFDGSAFLLAAGAYDFGKGTGVKEGYVVLDYVYQEPDPRNTFTAPLQHISSLLLRYDSGTWGLRTDLTGGAGYGGQSDLWGFSFLPFYSFNEHWQLVFRYTFMDASDPGGIRLGRYANRITDERGDEYHEFYTGVNWFLNGHRLKLQTGVEWARLTDSGHSGSIYEGWSWISALRVSW